MSILNKITNKEKEMIEAYIKAYSSYDGDGCSNGFGGVDHILREWDRQKECFLYKLLGEKLIHSTDVEYRKPIAQLEGELSDILYAHNTPSSRVRDAIECASNRYSARGIEAIYTKGSSVCGLINTNTLAKNEFTMDTFSLETPDGKTLSIQNGCKPVKMLAKIFKAFDLYSKFDVTEEDFEQFRIDVSQILNQRVIKGRLNLSIHPMDYMTMSDNGCDWSSCMSWREEGCYRQGTVEMMNSKYVIVAYLASKEDMDLDIWDYSGTWNSKKWRELFVVTENSATGIKGYPYQNISLEKAVLGELKTLFAKNMDTEFIDEIFKYSYGSAIHYCKDDDDDHEKNTILRFYTGYMYNDFGTRKYHRSILTEDAFNEREHQITYSGASECVYCGNLDIDIEGEGHLTCDPYADMTYCDSCGDRYHSDDMYCVDDQWYCYDCYEQYTSVSVVTGERHNNDDFTRVYLVKDGEDPNTNGPSILIDDDCESSNPADYDRFFKCTYHNVPAPGSIWRRIRFFYESDLTEKGIELFEDYGD